MFKKKYYDVFFFKSNIVYLIFFLFFINAILEIAGILSLIIISSYIFNVSTIKIFLDNINTTFGLGGIISWADLIYVSIATLVIKNIYTIFLFYFLNKTNCDYQSIFIKYLIKKIITTNYTVVASHSQSKILSFFPVIIENAYLKYFFYKPINFGDYITVSFTTVILIAYFGIIGFFATIFIIFLTFFFYKILKKYINKQSVLRVINSRKIMSICKNVLDAGEFMRVSKLNEDMTNFLKKIVNEHRNNLFITNIITQSAKPTFEIIIITFIIVGFKILNLNYNNIFIFNLAIIFICLLRLLPLVIRIFLSEISIKNQEPEIDELYHFSNVLENSEKFTRQKKINVEYNNSNNIIYLKNIYFGFKKKIFNNFSTKFKLNNIYIIRGVSGVGKSTLASILLQTLSLKKGSVVFNKKFKNLLKDNYYDNFNYAPQKDFLIPTSVKNNITLKFDETINKKNLNKSLKWSNCINFLNKLKLGLNTKINDFGNNFSGGECKRIILARFFYNLKLINILDEPTNHLDKYSKKVLLKNLKLIKKNRLIIILSHDQIFLKDKTFKFINL
jgi:ATP-binding cassette subfamily C protein